MREGRVQAGREIADAHPSEGRFRAPPIRRTFCETVVSPVAIVAPRRLGRRRGISVTEYGFLALLLCLAFYSFWSERLRPDMTALLVMLALIVPWPHQDGQWRGVLTYEQGFSGFGSAAVVMIASMFVMGAALVQTGAAEAIGLRLLRRVAGREWRLQMSVLGLATGMSMFVNDTTVVVVLMPLVVGVCRENDLPPSRYLLLAAFGSLLGGQWTLIGTRSNIILSDYLRQRGEGGIGFFDFTPTAAAVFVVSAAFIFFIGRRWLPATRTSVDSSKMTEFLTEIAIPEGSQAIETSINDVALFREGQLRLIAVVRDGRRVFPGVLRAGDLILVRGTAEQISQVVKSSDFTVQDEANLDRAALAKVDLVTVEAVISPSSYYVGATLDQLALSHRFDVTVLGIERRGQRLTDRVMSTPLAHGDVVLLLGRAEDVERLGATRDLVVLEERTFPAIGTAKASIVVGLMGAVIASSIAGLLPPTISIPLAATLAILFGCISARAAYLAIDWPTLVILGGMIPFGLALEESGAAELIAALVVGGLPSTPPMVPLGALLLIAIVLTQIIENAAVAIIIAPIAFQVAQISGFDAKAVMIPLAVCISAGFATPVAHESTILVMGSGAYKFKDYARIGGVLALITWVVAVLVTPLIWPLTR
jgi:di/tricarboxylate transporter